MYVKKNNKDKLLIQVLGLKLVENFFCDIIPASLTCIKHSNKTSPQRRQIKDLLNIHMYYYIFPVRSLIVRLLLVLHTIS